MKRYSTISVTLFAAWFFASPLLAIWMYAITSPDKANGPLLWALAGVSYVMLGLTFSALYFLLKKKMPSVVAEGTQEPEIGIWRSVVLYYFVTNIISNVVVGLLLAILYAAHLAPSALAHALLFVGFPISVILGTRVAMSSVSKTVLNDKFLRYSAGSFAVLNTLLVFLLRYNKGEMLIVWGDLSTLFAFYAFFWSTKKLIEKAKQ